ncbi:MAG: protein kinase domain-containing protein [Acidimicrobiia bacterium]
MPTNVMVDFSGRVLGGRYRLLAPIGTGASGRVYVADDVNLRRRVAVKVLHPAFADDAAFLRRFRAEAQIAASLHHPNIVSVYDWGEDDDVPYLVLELLEGGSLRSMLDAPIRLTPAQAAQLGQQLCSALAYAHANGLVHRDIKPGNLLFDEHGIVRIADFGLARALAEASLTEPTGTLVGTARYAAPEQASAQALDGRADCYALALVLIESVIGTVPLTADTAIGTIGLRTRESVHVQGEFGALGPALERAGRANPDERYPDAATMASALADAALLLPIPGPLTLVGSGDTGLSDPTQHVSVVVEPDTPKRRRKDRTRPVVIARESRRRVRIAPILVVVALLAVLAGAAAFLLGSFGGRVAAPNAVGLYRTDAAARAAQQGLTVRIVEVRADDPPGLVLEQSPTAGTFVRDGARLTLRVSSGPPPVAVPEVAGKSLADAQQLFTSAGFVMVVERRNDEAIARDLAITTDPKPGTALVPESSITIIVSDGPAPVPVPNVAGKTYDEAVKALDAAKLKATRAEEFSDTVAVGQVTRTDPASGQLAARSVPVTVYVSKGPELVVVPSVVGLPVEQAAARLQGIGLLADVQNFGVGKPVRAQDPASGKLKKGSKVTLFL